MTPHMMAGGGDFSTEFYFVVYRRRGSG